MGITLFFTFSGLYKTVCRGYKPGQIVGVEPDYQQNHDAKAVSGLRRIYPVRKKAPPFLTGFTKGFNKENVLAPLEITHHEEQSYPSRGFLTGLVYKTVLKLTPLMKILDKIRSENTTT